MRHDESTACSRFELNGFDDNDVLNAEGATESTRPPSREGVRGVQRNMIVSRFHPTKQSRQRSNLLLSLSAADLLSATLIGLALAAPLIRENAWLNAFIWIMSCWTAWALTRPTRRLLVTDHYSRAVMAPLLAFVLSLAVVSFAHQNHDLRFLLLSTLAWMVALLVARFFTRRYMPPVVIGVLNNVKQPLSSSDRVRYTRLTDTDRPAWNDVDALLIDPTASLRPEWVALLMHAHAAGVPTWTPAALDEEITGRVSLEYLRGQHLDPGEFQSQYIGVKRVLETLGVILLLPVLLPIMGIVALLVLIDTGRPILFWQDRVGMNGTTFRIVKFRTMRRDSERHGAQFAANGDARVTRLGKWLRKFRLDELPQFWNVLRGDMSVIGPRPEQEAFVQQFNRDIPLYPMRHWVRPGITGWAQVTHGYASGKDETFEKLRHDVYYIKHFSFWLDVRIVVKTIWTILTGFGAR